MNELKISYATMEDREYVATYGIIAESEVDLKIRDKRCYILREGDEFIGIMRWNMIFEFIPFLSLMYLEEPHRHKGYGRLAMAHWEDEMRATRYKMIMISTQVDEDGQHFYRKLGYKDMGTIVMDIPPYEQPLEMFMGKAL
ncbi:MAG: GNAT family N-acetyltransferase [Defluviitaleaceae bacterium]|nr:GNAT family N-acetyltransferase [Defluviitaleaceae bacterium]